MKQQHNEFYTFLIAGREKKALRIHEKEIQAHPEPADVSERAEKAFSFLNKEWLANSAENHTQASSLTREKEV